MDRDRIGKIILIGAVLVFILEIVGMIFQVPEISIVYKYPNNKLSNSTSFLPVVLSLIIGVIFTTEWNIIKKIIAIIISVVIFIIINNGIL